MTFQDLQLHAGLLKALEEAGYQNPTPVQASAIPILLAGKDLRASAPTGTGKTAGFLLPALQRLTVAPTHPGHGPRVLVLAPTRELAMQVATEAVKYSKHLQRAKVVCVYGGVPYHKQQRELSRPYEILVATPGRLIDFIDQGKIKLSRVEFLVLDEADRMLDMGFIDPVKQIAAATPKDRQTVLFSATLQGPVLQLSNQLLKNPEEVTLERDKESRLDIEQRVHAVDNIQHKHRLLDHLLNDEALKQVIVFTATKSQATLLVDKLLDAGHRAAALHGDMNQRQRSRTMAQLRQGSIRVLVATDVAARGIDVLTISHVINFDLPNNSEDYVHRIGRTGRAGSTGIALSFASPKDMQSVRRIEQFTGQKMTAEVIPGFEPTGKSSYPPKGGPGGQRPQNRFGGQRNKKWQKR